MSERRPIPWRVVISLALILFAVTWGFWGRLGPAPPRPAHPEQLDPLVRERIESELRHADWHRRDLEAWMSLGLTYQANELDGLARACYGHVLERHPDHARAWFHRATSHATSGEVTAAVDDMAHAAAAAPDYAPARWRRAQWLLELGRLDDAAVEIARAGSIEMDDAVALITARIELAFGHLEEADAAAQLVLDGDLAPEGERIRAQVHRRRGELDAARAAEGRAGTAHVDLTDPWSSAVSRRRTGLHLVRNEALRRLDAGDATSARARIDRLLEYDAQDVDALQMLAAVEMASGDFLAARAAVDRALAVDPEHFGANLNVAVIVAAAGAGPAGSLSEGLRHVARALDLQPDHGRAWAVRGYLLERDDRLDEAISSYDRSYRLDARTPDALLRAIAIDLRRDSAPAALARARRLLADFPSQPRVVEALGAAAVLAGNPDAAREALAAIDALPPPARTPQMAAMERRLRAQIP